MGGTKLCTINFDGVNIDGDNPETIIHIIHNLWLGTINLNYRKSLKIYIS